MEQSCLTFQFLWTAIPDENDQGLHVELNNYFLQYYMYYQKIIKASYGLKISVFDYIYMLLSHDPKRRANRVKYVDYSKDEKSKGKYSTLLKLRFTKFHKELFELAELKKPIC